MVKVLDQGQRTLGVRILRGSLIALMKALFRIEHVGLANIPNEGPLVLVANHVTYLDPFWIATPIRRATRFMAWDRIFDFPVAGSVFRWLGAFPVSLENPEVTAFKKALGVLRNGEALLVFPEGGRSPDGRLLPFKEGAASLALRTGANLMPVVVHGGERVWSPRMRIPRPGKIVVHYLEPIPSDSLAPPASDIMERVRSLLEHELEHGRPQSGATGGHSARRR